MSLGDTDIEGTDNPSTLNRNRWGQQAINGPSMVRISRQIVMFKALAHCAIRKVEQGSKVQNPSVVPFYWWIGKDSP